MRELFQGTDRLYRTTGRIFDVVECSGCRLLRLYPWPSPSELTGYYPQDYWFAPAGTAGRLEETYRRVVLRDHVNFVHRALEDAEVEGPVLDVGCGGGLFTRLLAQRGHRVFGFDYSEQAAAVAWRVNGVGAACGALTGAPFRRGSLKAITMFHVLEHLYDPAGYLQAAYDLLKPGGRIVVQVPNAASWQFLLLGSSWNGIDIPRHLVDYRDRDVDHLLEHCGFEVLRHKYFSLRDNPAGLASSITPSLDPMARRVRQLREGTFTRLIKDLIYLGLVVAALPFAALEAACRAGSTVMVEARKP